MQSVRNLLYVSRIRVPRGLNCYRCLPKVFQNTRWKRRKTRRFEGAISCSFSPLNHWRRGSNLEMYSFPPFSTHIFKNFVIHSIICVAQLLLIFVQRAPALITFSGAFIPLFPSPSKACHAGNVLLQMDAKYLLVCVLGARPLSRSLLGRRLKGKGVYKRARASSFPYLFAFKHPPRTLEVSATTYSSFLSNLPKYHIKSTLAMVYRLTILKTKFQTKRGTNDLFAICAKCQRQRLLKWMSVSVHWLRYNSHSSPFRPDFICQPRR